MPVAKTKTSPKAKVATKAKPAPVKAEPKARQMIDKSAVYEASGGYNPKAEANIASYAAVCKVLPAKYEDIIKQIPEHTDFVGYLVRRGGIEKKK